MAELALEILSDDDDCSTPLQCPAKKPNLSTATPFLIIDDDPTPSKPAHSSAKTPSFVPETPFLDASPEGHASIVRCTASGPSSSRPAAAEKLQGIHWAFPMLRLIDSFVDGILDNFAAEKADIDFDFAAKKRGVAGLICLESDNESESHSPHQQMLENEMVITMPDLVQHSKASAFQSSSFCRSAESDLGSCSPEGEVLAGSNNDDSLLVTANVIKAIDHCTGQSDCFSEGTSVQANYNQGESSRLEQVDTIKLKDRRAANAEKKRRRDEEAARKQQLKEERKLKRECEKQQKEALKAEAAEMKRLQKEKDKWEKGKFATKSVVAEIDAKVVETGLIGGHLLSRFAEKGLTYRITSNPIERSILWKMSIPDQISELTSKGSEVSYILFVFEGEDFCNLVMNESLMDHVQKVQRHFLGYRICYVTNRLIAYINKREQFHYKNPSGADNWRRPPVEEALSKLAINFNGVHSRLCVDEADLAEHVVGLTCSLATCQFRKKPTRLSVSANGSLVPKDFIDKHLIKKSIWLKALVSIPKVQPRFAIAIWKKYPTMRSLLNVYMDPRKSVHEKEFLLKDLMTEGPLGREERRVGEVCSKRVYRILMAQNGNMKTDDAEDGAGFFGS